MKYAYPAIFYPDGECISVDLVDFPGCETFGNNMADALLMTKELLEYRLYVAENQNEPFPIPSKLEDIEVEPGHVLNLVAADTDAYRREHDTENVSKVVFIPSWLHYQAEIANAPFSEIMKQGLEDYLRAV